MQLAVAQLIVMQMISKLASYAYSVIPTTCIPCPPLHGRLMSCMNTFAQMGGKEGVLEKQSIALSTLQPEGGLWVRCIPRSSARKDAQPRMPSAGSCGQLEALPEDPDDSGALT